MLVDLHTHSYYSDGTMSPREVVEDAKRKNIEVVALTEHNDLSSYKEALETGNKIGVKVIRGVEVDSKFEDTVVHILCYKFNENEKFFEIINNGKEALLETSIELVSRMSKDYNEISNEDYKAYEYDRKKGGWKGIHYLLDRKITDKLFDGMKFYGEYDCGHVRFDFPTVEEVCNAVHQAGGYAVLAHPCNYYKDKTKEEILEKLNEFKQLGIDGVECYYPANSEMMTETCIEFCKKNDMIITCGSDGHGDFGAISKGIEYYIGAMKVDSEKLLNIEKLLK